MCSGWPRRRATQHSLRVADGPAQRTAQGVRLLWDHDWWDGPVSGLAEFEGNEYWYEAVWDPERDDWSHPRRYVLRELTAAELEDEWQWHRLFEKHVSTMHCRHDAAPPSEVRPGGEWRTFYDAYGARRTRSYSERAVVAEFRLDRAE